MLCGLGLNNYGANAPMGRRVTQDHKEEKYLQMKQNNLLIIKSFKYGISSCLL